MADSATKFASKFVGTPTARRAPARGLSTSRQGAVADAMAKLHAAGGNHAVSAMLRGGIPLPDNMRDELEQRFGTDLSDVRVHNDGAAHESAAAMHANAYTFGSDIVFGTNRFAPQSPSGKRLLAHEIAHVIQQRRGGAAPALSSNAAHEHGAAAAANAFTGPGPVAVQGSTGVGVARDKSDEKTPADPLEELDALVDTAASAVAGDNVFLRRLVAAALHGYIKETRAQLVDPARVERVRERAAKLKLLNPGTIPAFAGGFAAGLGTGSVSPVTDLFGLPAFADAADDFIKQIAKSIGPNASALLAEGNEIAAQFWQLQDEMTAVLVEVMLKQARDPTHIPKMIAAAEDIAVQMAGRMGEGAATTTIQLLESAGEEEKEQDPGWESVLPKDVGAAMSNPGWALSATASRAWEYGSERAKKAIFSTPRSRTGYAIGHTIGMVVSNVLLFVSTDGIGNAISKISWTLGKLAPALRSFGTVATKIAEALGAIGKVATEVEETIAVVAKTALEPLERVLKPFKKLLERLQAWLRGVEKEGAEIASAASTKLAGEVPKGASKLSPSPKVEPHLPAGTAADDATAAIPKDAPLAKSTTPDVTPAPKGEPEVTPQSKATPEIEAKPAAKPTAKKAKKPGASKKPNAPKAAPVSLEEIEARLEKLELVRLPKKARQSLAKQTQRARDLARKDPAKAEGLLKALEDRFLPPGGAQAGKTGEVLEDLGAAQQKLFPEKGPSGKHTQSKAIDERAQLEQGKPDPKRVRQARNKESEQLGETGGIAKAQEYGIKIEDWNPPQKFKGEFGRGIDRIGTRDGKTIVLEWKYGGSGLGKGQMSNEWVGRKIAELQAVGDTEGAALLLKAADKGDLEGAVYWTRQLKAGEKTSLQRGSQLRDKLRAESISEDGLIKYSPEKVRAAYQARLDELNAALKRRDLSALGSL